MFAISPMSKPGKDRDQDMLADMILRWYYQKAQVAPNEQSRRPSGCREEDMPLCS